MAIATGAARGRASARETASRVAAGAVARLVIPEVVDPRLSGRAWRRRDRLCGVRRGRDRRTTPSSAPTPPPPRAGRGWSTRRARPAARSARSWNASPTGVPAGWGAPLYAKLDAELAAACMSMNAVKGVEIGDGFAAARAARRGECRRDAGRAGRRAAFPEQPCRRRARRHFDRPADRRPRRVQADLLDPDAGGDGRPDGAETEIATKGRHDPCVAIRGAPVIEAMVALVLADQKLLHRAQCGDGGMKRIDVALGERSYTILIGAGLLDRTGTEFAPPAQQRAARRRQRRECLGRAGRELPRWSGLLFRRFRRADHPPAGRGHEELDRARRPGRPAARCGRGARRSYRRVRRRRDRRSGRLRRRDPQARLRLRPDPDHPARAGRFLGRRQDRDQHARRQESGRRLPPAVARPDRPDLSRHPAAARAARRLCRGRQIRPDRRSGLLRLVRGEWRRPCSPATRTRAATPSRSASPPRPRSSPRTSARPGAARPAQPRPHLRPRAGSRDRLFRRLLHGEAVALGMLLAFRFSAERGLCAAAGCGPGRRPSRRRRPADPARRPAPAPRSPPIWRTTRRRAAAGSPSS